MLFVLFCDHRHVKHITGAHTAKYLIWWDGGEYAMVGTGSFFLWTHHIVPKNS